MQLTIFDKFRPFSHAAGASYLLPGTTLAFTIYPTRIEWRNLATSGSDNHLVLKATGPVHGFTSQLDLEKGVIYVWGLATEGYYKYRIQPREGNFVIVPIKGRVLEGEFVEEGVEFQPTLPIEQLHLGISKKQEWELVHRRCDVAELLPFWYALAQQIPASNCDCTPSLYAVCKKLIAEREITAISAAFKSLYLAAFGGVLIPRLNDEDYQGFTLPPFEAASPTAILTSGGELIRSLLFTATPPLVQVLPSLPVEFHSGRAIRLKIAHLGEVDLEWTKKLIRRLVFRCAKETNLQFIFQKELRRFRLREVGSRQDQIISCGTSLDFKAGRVYLLDNFQK